MANWRQVLGVARSLITYYGVPFRLRRMTRFYGQFIQPGDLCFDVGAHVGNRLVAWLRLGARIVALEPQPHLMWLLRRWYGRCDQIILLEQAVGSTAGEGTMYVSESTPTVTTLSREWMEEVREVDSFAAVDWNTAVSVSTTTLDHLIAQYGRPAFCKIDVEGYELEVLQGLSQSLPALCFEFTPATPQRTSACLARLAELGPYEFNWSRAESHRWQSPTWMDTEGITAVLQQLPRNNPSGDVYARLVG